MADDTAPAKAAQDTFTHMFSCIVSPSKKFVTMNDLSE